MYKPPQTIDVRRPDHKFRWTYIVNRPKDSNVIKTLQKFKCISRCGVPQSDWVSGGAWGSPVIPLAPPAIGHGV